jgi:YegS/Rv2252/BmrU family lipid kinase
LTRAAFIVNPTKSDELGALREAVTAAMAKVGWEPPLWLETTEDDPGRGQAEDAIKQGVAVVLVCGGDGTITACASALANSGVPLAIVPAGTGNLLARNLELPLDRDAALEIALTGSDRALDVGTLDGEPFVVMAGMGLDAVMLSDASEALKARIGWAAYVVSAARHLRDRPVEVELTGDDAAPIHRRIHGLVVGNVGRLQGGVPLLPDAHPDDGFLDVVVLTPLGPAGWLRLAVAVLLRRENSPQFDRLRVKSLKVRAGRAMPCERDGEVCDSRRDARLDIMAGALLVRCIPVESATKGNRKSPSVTKTA